jgi:hypothetical protein
VGRTSVEAVGEDPVVLGEVMVGEDPTVLSKVVVAEERAHTTWTRWRSVRHR